MIARISKNSKLTMEEMKSLSKDDRYELADAIGKEKGMLPTQTPEGRMYK